LDPDVAAVGQVSRPVVVAQLYVAEVSGMKSWVRNEMPLGPPKVAVNSAGWHWNRCGLMLGPLDGAGSAGRYCFASLVGARSRERKVGKSSDVTCRSRGRLSRGDRYNLQK
jgi:hypothetical protein